MEEQLAELAAQVAAMEAKGNLTNTMFAEAYYYLTIPLMIIIHAGFLAYEMGASRAKNARTRLNKMKRRVEAYDENYAIWQETAGTTQGRIAVTVGIADGPW